MTDFNRMNLTFEAYSLPKLGLGHDETRATLVINESMWLFSSQKSGPN